MLLNSFRSGSAGFNDRHGCNYLKLQVTAFVKEKNDDRGLSVLPPVGAFTLLQDPARGLRSWNLSRGAASLTRACC